MKPILLVARSLTSAIPLQTNLCTPLLWFWSRAEVYCKRKVLCTNCSRAPSFPLRNANWKRLQSKIVSSNFLKDATLQHKWSKYLVPRWLPASAICVFNHPMFWRYLPTTSRTKNDQWRWLCHIKEGECHQSREGSKGQVGVEIWNSICLTRAICSAVNAKLS